MKWLFLLSIGAILASIVYQIIVSSSSRVVRLVPSQGIIVISSSSGGGREMALKLADVGFHVIVGVSTSKEKSSYKYSTSKGVDPMLLDLSEPGQIAQLHYKLQSLTMKHERNVVGVVFIKDDQSSKKSDSIDIDRNYLHDTYQDQLQGTLRLYQALVPFFNFSVGRVVFVRYQRAKDFMQRSSLFGCGISCSFLSTDVEIIRHHHFLKQNTEQQQQQQQQLQQRLPSSSVFVVNTVIGEVKLFPLSSQPTSLNKSNTTLPSSIPSIHRETIKRQTFNRTIGAVLHSLSSVSPQDTYSVGSIDFTITHQAIKDRINSFNPIRWLQLNRVGYEERSQSMWVTSLSLETVHWFQELLPPVAYRTLINYFLI